MAETPTFGRYAEIPYEQMTPEQQEGYRSLIETRGRLPGPNKIYVHNPKLAKVMGPLGAHFRTGYSLSEREREIAVCIITSKFHAAYPTNAHERAAKAAGLPPDTVEAILAGLPTSFSDKREQVVYEMATCLANARWVSKGLYDRAVDALGHVGITDVITLMGFYSSVIARAMRPPAGKSCPSHERSMVEPNPQRPPWEVATVSLCQQRCV